MCGAGGARREARRRQARRPARSHLLRATAGVAKDTTRRLPVGLAPERRSATHPRLRCCHRRAGSQIITRYTGLETPTLSERTIESTPRDEAAIVADLIDLLQLEFDALPAYSVAIAGLRRPDLRGTLEAHGPTTNGT